jgi:4-oxalocrotonate tautomerase
MPHVSVKLATGRSEQQKTQLAEAIVKDVMNILNTEEETVSVAIEEFDPQDWMAQVYQPDIQCKRDKLYKKPGYGPMEE